MACKCYDSFVRYLPQLRSRAIAYALTRRLRIPLQKSHLPLLSFTIKQGKLSKLHKKCKVVCIFESVYDP